MAVASERLPDLVSLERGEIDRSIFRDPEIFEQEMRTIFGRSWLLLCHESQIPRKGDFFEAAMGRDNVLVVRQRDGGVKALLNTCLHRGNAVCRAEEGNARNFMCTYHGWTYDIDGKLVGVPGLAELYHNELDPAANGLREVAQLADNAFDWYHPQITHLSAFRSGLIRALPDPTARGRTVGLEGVAAPDGSQMRLYDEGAGDHIVFIDHYGHAISGQTAASLGDMGGLLDNSWREPGGSDEFGEMGKGSYGHTNLFPHCTIIPWMMQIGLRVPRGPELTEVWWFSFVKKDASPEQRAATVRRAVITFGPAGLAEQDDGENWVQSTMQTSGWASSQIPQLLRMNLGHGKVVQDEASLDPPYIQASINEHGQLWTYHAWQQWMSGAGWDELRSRTTPLPYQAHHHQRRRPRQARRRTGSPLQLPPLSHPPQVRGNDLDRLPPRPAPPSQRLLPDRPPPHLPRADPAPVSQPQQLLLTPTRF